APTAGLKAAVLSSVLGGGGATAAGGGAAVTGLGAAKGVAAKTMICAAIAGSAGSAGYVAVRDTDTRMHTPPMQAQKAHNPPKAHHRSAAVAKPAASAAPAALASATIASAPAKVAPAAPAHRASSSHHRGRHFFKWGDRQGHGHRGFGSGTAPREQQ